MIAAAGMPSIDVDFTEEEWAVVRSAASDTGMSVVEFAKQAILGRATGRARRVTGLAHEVADRSAELNRRLGH
ncbi:Uncharacterised protein [Mycobacteroides abscessus subsp. abscessus]|nr:Uncharacterised protein [Mycobacteroides abscessus subsp. abscessus]SLH39314.1 Uncharacterised protein [Mycobacteroides abscessus subsp. abscessus]